jgi:glutathione S-transferase
MRNADGNVEALLDEVNNAVNEHDARRHVQMSLQELADEGRDVHPAEHCRSRHRHLPARFGERAAHRVLGFADLAEDALDVGVEARAAFGELDDPRVAIEELGADMLLQQLDGTCHRRRRHAGASGRCGEARLFRDSHEGLIELDAVHRYSTERNSILTVALIDALRPNADHAVQALRDALSITGTIVMIHRHPSLRLYGHSWSGHAHRVELLLSFLGLSAELIDIDISNGEHKSPAFLAKSPFGVVPVLEDGDLLIADSGAILVYLALKHDRSDTWYPRDALVAAQVQRWLAVAAVQLYQGPAAARAHKLFGAPFDYVKSLAVAEQLFLDLDRHLADRDHLAATHATIADLALYSYTAHAPEGGMTLEPYPALRRWLRRIEALDGFLAMRRVMHQANGRH